MHPSKLLAAALLIAVACRQSSDGVEDPRGVDEPAPEPGQPDPSPPPEPLEIMLEQARSLVRGGDIEAANQLLDQARSETDGVLALARIDAVRVAALVTRGDVEAALKLAEQAVERLDQHGASGRPVAEAYNALGHALLARLELGQADEAWLVASRHCEGDDPAIRLLRGRIRFNRAMVLNSRGQLDQALPIARAGLQDEAAGGAPPCPDLATTRGNLADLLARMGRFAESDAMFHEAKLSCKGNSGAELILADLDIAWSKALAQQGRTEQALAVVRDARARLKTDHLVATLRAVRAVLAESLILRRTGQAEVARMLLDESVPGFQEALGPSHPQLFSLCLEQQLVVHERGDALLPSRVEECRAVAEALGYTRGTSARREFERLVEHPAADVRRVTGPSPGAP